MKRYEYISERRQDLEALARRDVEVTDLFRLRVYEHYLTEIPKHQTRYQARCATGRVFGYSESSVRRFIARMTEEVNEPIF